MVIAAIDPAMGGIIVAIISSLVTYLIAARNLSGKIKNSDASQLWAESRSIREWSMERVKELDAHIDRLEQRVIEVEKRNTALAEENRKLQREIYDLRNTINEMQTQNTTLTNLLNDEKAQNAHLRWEAEHAPRRRASDPPIEGEDEDDRTT